jgi:hypothetical protein
LVVSVEITGGSYGLSFIVSSNLSTNDQIQLVAASNVPKVRADDPPLSCNFLFVIQISGMLKSRQIFLAKWSEISLCRGTADRRPLSGLPHQE